MRASLGKDSRIKLLRKAERAARELLHPRKLEQERRCERGDSDERTARPLEPRVILCGVQDELELTQERVPQDQPCISRRYLGS